MVFKGDSQINFFTKDVELMPWVWVGFWYDVFQTTVLYQL